MTPRRRLILTGAACLFVGALAGRMSAPAPEVEERIRIETVEVMSDRTEWVTQREAATDTRQVSVTERGPVVTTWPDGRREERGPETVRVETDTRARETEALSATSEQMAVSVAVTEVERIVRVPEQLDWLLGAQVGAGSVGLMYGGQVSRRVLGPLYLTAGAMAGGGEWVATGGVAVGW